MWASMTDNEMFPGAFLDYRPKDLFWRRAEISKNVWTGKDLGYVVQVWYDDNFILNFDNDDPGPALLAAT